jgi:hypothetical protein
MTKHLSAGAMCAHLKEKSVTHFKALEQTETNPFMLNNKSQKGYNFPELEQELLAWLCRNETRHAALTDNILKEKAKKLLSE